jgi:hypothetical protein
MTSGGRDAGSDRKRCGGNIVGICCAFILLCLALPVARAESTMRPVIDGEWWQVAGNPNLGGLSTPSQQPVDFSIWQAADGTWQIWSCVRNTKVGGTGRLFYRWEGARLTDKDWKPMGIAATADPAYGEAEGGLQAPHVVRWQGRWVMAYGDWERIRFRTSRDGKTFERRILKPKPTDVFTEGPGANTRDPMLLRTSGLWRVYYTAFHGDKGYVFSRTSPDLKSWSDSIVVAYGGQAGTNIWSCECPFVVELSPGHYYLFRTQVYGRDARTSIYHSTNPSYFGIDDDRGLVGTLPVAAPEIFRHDGRWYIAALMPDLDGIRIARLRWEPKL